jgi:hypothetical protein
MAETTNRHLAAEQATISISRSIAEMKAAIRETRSRLAVRLAQTADHAHLLFTSPSTAETETRNPGVIGSAAKTIAVAGRAKRIWSDAKRTGLLRRAALGSVTVAIAAALATRPRRR